MTEQITIHRPTVADGTDEQGNPNVGADEEIESDGWLVAPLTASEDSVATGLELIDGFTLYKRDEWVEIRPDDRVEVRGDFYAVTSPTNQWQNTVNVERGTVVTVRRVA